MEKSSKIENIRALRIKELLKRENLKQKHLADSLDIEPQNLSRCLVSGKVSEKMCKNIAALFPEYRKEWLMGIDDFMTQDDFKRAYIKNSDIRNNALLTVMDAALHEACLRENIPVPTLENIPELILLESQLRDYAVSLMAGYLHREDSHFWSNLDSLLSTAEEKLKK